MYIYDNKVKLKEKLRLEKETEAKERGGSVQKQEESGALKRFFWFLVKFVVMNCELLWSVDWKFWKCKYLEENLKLKVITCSIVFANIDGDSVAI